MKMRCRKATRGIGPYVDGELAAPEARRLRSHLDTCEDCSRRFALMSELVREVSSLPAIVPTPEESYRLMNRLRREEAAPTAPKPSSRRIQVAAAAMSLLAIATVTGVGIAIWSGRGTAPVSEEASSEDTRSGEPIKKGADNTAGLLDDETKGLQLATAALASPDLVVSDKDYSPSELENFRNDLGTRLDFYSTYWYPASGAATEPAALAGLQAELTDDLAQKAAAAGQNPDEVKQAVAAVLEQEAGEPVLPCYAERAKINGKDSWLVSVSGPEDYLLFSDQKRPPAMFLASLGGEEGLEVSESLLRELAAMLAPYDETNWQSISGGVSVETMNATQDGEGREETAKAPGATMEGEVREEKEPLQAREDFQSFLRDLAARGTNLDLISALEGLNYEQLLMLVHGDWAALAADGVNLSDFLTPPKRLWGVDCATRQVVWPP